MAFCINNNECYAASLLMINLLWSTSNVALLWIRTAKLRNKAKKFANFSSYSLDTVLLHLYLQATADSILLHSRITTAVSTLLHPLSTAYSTLLHSLSTAYSTLHPLSTADSTLYFIHYYYSIYCWKHNISSTVYCC